MTVTAALLSSGSIPNTITLPLSSPWQPGLNIWKRNKNQSNRLCRPVGGPFVPQVMTFVKFIATRIKSKGRRRTCLTIDKYIILFNTKERERCQQDGANSLQWVLE